MFKNKRTLPAIFCLFFPSLFFAVIAHAELTDPTRPANYHPNTLAGSDENNTQEKGLILSAILRSPERTMAIINEQLLNVGDTVRGYEILAIEPHTVSLKGPSGITILPLLSTSIKQSPTASGNKGKAL